MSLNVKQMEKIVNDARALAINGNHSMVTADHLLRTLLDEDQVTAFLDQISVDAEELSNDLDEVLSDDTIHGSSRGRVNPDISNIVSEVMQNAVGMAMSTPNKTVTSLHLLAAMVMIPEAKQDSHAFILLKSGKVTLTKIKDYQMDTGMGDGESETIASEEEAISFLKKFTKNLNEEAKHARIDPLIGRETEVADIVLKIARRTKKNVIVTGEPGTGKSAIVEGLAKLIVEGKVPKTIENSTVYSLSIPDLIAGTKYRGEAEERIRNLVVALGKVPNPILFIDEIHMMMGAGAGSSSSLDMANILKPALARGQIRCIGATTHDEYLEHIEKDRALMRRFQVVQVEEPSLEACKAILTGLAETYGGYHGVTYSKEAIDAAVEMSARYIQNRHLPDKAIDVLDASGARQRVRGEDRDREITVDHIRNEVSIIAKVPVADVGRDDLGKLRTLQSDLQGKVFGQDAAIQELVDSVMVAKTGMRARKKTLGAFLLAGPSGCGKTESAKQLADTLSMNLVRFDMSEYREPHTISKLIGSPPGYVGFGQGGAGSGLLITAVERNPHSIVLLDEIEKAHKDIFNLFLQAMDDGVMTSGSGKKVSFENVILLMTSNVGSQEAAASKLGFTTGSSQYTVDDSAVNRMFTPEFRNRLDAILKFQPLTRTAMLGIVDKFIAEVHQQVSEQGFALVVTDKAREKLAQDGYDPAMGARPLNRLITEKVKKPVSRAIVFGDTQPGSMIMVDVGSDDQFTVKFGHGSEQETNAELS